MGKIIIEGDAGYQHQVRWILDEIIAKSTTGALILDAVKSTAMQVTIVPFQEENVCNAYVSVLPWDTSNSSRKGDFVLDRKGKPTTAFYCIGPIANLCSPQEGTGIGADATVVFSPSTFWNNGPCSNKAPPGSAGAKPSEVLVHELIHAYRRMRGTAYPMATMGGRKDYDNLEEFAAIVITNVYISDQSTPGYPKNLRATHHGFATLSATQSTTAGFLAEAANRRLIDMIVKDEPELCKVLETINAAFNPFQPPGTSTYVVQQGDSLSKISRKFYQSEGNWEKIYEANRHVIGKDANVLRPGQVLRIPGT